MVTKLPLSIRRTRRTSIKHFLAAVIDNSLSTHIKRLIDVFVVRRTDNKYTHLILFEDT